MAETTRTTTTTTEKVASPATPPPLPDPKVVMKTSIKKKKKRFDPVVVGAGLLILFLAIWYFFLRPAPATNVTIRYASVETGDISKSVSATGTLQATTTVQVGSQVSGVIKELYADFNTRVTKGQLLAVLDPTFYQASLTEAQANLSRAHADLDAAQHDEARQRDLLAKQLIAKAEYETSKNKLLDQEAAVRQQEAEVRKAEVNVGYTIIRSPISGVVVSRNVDKGQTVAASLNAPVLFNIAQDLSSMQVSANVDEADIGQVVDGQQVKFTVDAYPTEQFSGTVSQVRINPVVASNVVTYAVIILTNNPNGKLLPGMTATVNIVSASKNGVLRIPSSALRFVPTPEVLGTAAKGDTTATRTRRQRAPGDTTHRGGQGERPIERTIWVKARTTQKGATPIQPVRIVPGLSDGSYTEVVSSNPPLHAGDSVVVGAFTPSSTTSAPASGSSPLGGARPGGGLGGVGGGGGGRGGR